MGGTGLKPGAGMSRAEQTATFAGLGNPAPFQKKVWFKEGVPHVSADHPDFGGMDTTGVVDASAALQAAIDYAQTLTGPYPGIATGAPNVVLPPGLISIASPITLKSAPLVGAGMNSGTRVKWIGAAGATVLVKDSTYTGGTTFGGIRGVTFLAAAPNEPATWLDLTMDGVDNGWRLSEVQFANCTSDAIKMAGWVNLHWEHLRFDAVGGYAIRATVQSSSQNLSSFLIDSFTYDHQRASGNGTGFLKIDNTVDASNLGVLALKNARVEINTALTGHKALVDYKVGTAARALGIHLENIAFAGKSGETGQCLVYQDTAATNLFPSLTLVNVRQSNCEQIVLGTLSTQYPPITLQSNYDLLGVAGGGYDVIGTQIRALTTGFGSEAPFSFRRASDTVDRWVMDSTGRMTFGSGSAAGDVNLYRSAADMLKTDDSLTVAGNQIVTGTLSVGGVAVSTVKALPPFKTASWIYPPVVPGVQALALGRRYFIPVHLPSGVASATELTVDLTVVAGAGGLLRMGIYADNGSGMPTGAPLVDAGTIAADGAIGARSITISQALTGGRYHLCLQPEVSACTVRSTTGISPWAIMLNRVDNATPSNGGVYESGVSAGALATPAGALTQATMPLMGVKVA